MSERDWQLQVVGFESANAPTDAEVVAIARDIAEQNEELLQRLANWPNRKEQ